MHVRTYICVLKLEDAIQSTKFASQKQKASLNILYTAWWIKTEASRELKNFGLTHEQFNVLRILKGKHPEQMCVKDIGCRMIEKNSNVPRIVDRLELKKWVKRSTSPLDKRETVTTLTQAGLNILALANEKVNKLFADKLELNEAEAESLNLLLEKMRTKE